MARVPLGLGRRHRQRREGQNVTHRLDDIGGSRRSREPHDPRVREVLAARHGQLRENEVGPAATKRGRALGKR